MHRTHRRLGADQIHRRGVLESHRDDAGLLVAFALPFTLFAFFPSMLKKLPKSGGWLNSVKVVLGFIEVALGMKFLSVADQTYHWGQLDREIYLAVWIVTFSLLGLYLLGKIKFVHDSDMPYLGVGRLALAIVTFSLVVYLVPGMWGAPLKRSFGLPAAPAHAGLRHRTGRLRTGPGRRRGAHAADRRRTEAQTQRLPPPAAQPRRILRSKEAEAYAAKVGLKPLFIDFTGHGCVNCREMEARVWSDPQVLDILRNDYVIVALYRRQESASRERMGDHRCGQGAQDLGKINSYYALKTFGVNAQPYYVLQGRGGKGVGSAPRLRPRRAGIRRFLRSGVEAYDRRNRDSLPEKSLRPKRPAGFFSIPTEDQSENSSNIVVLKYFSARSGKTTTILPLDLLRRTHRRQHRRAAFDMPAKIASCG